VTDHAPQQPSSPTSEPEPDCEYPREERTTPSPNYSARLIKYDKAVVHGILDDGYLCHVAFVAPPWHGNQGGWPVAVPHLYSRVGGTLYLHGSPRSRLAEYLNRNGDAEYPVCVAVTHVDALIAARSAFEHVIAYRSATLHGRAYLVSSLKEKSVALTALIEQVISGRSKDTRAPSADELSKTALIGVRIETATAKVRTGGPDVDPGDAHSKHWAGIIPIRQVYGPPISSPDLETGVTVPDYIRCITEVKNQRNIRFTAPYEKPPSTEATEGDSPDERSA
jgi:nitroimidazol reductase NimA-like FMN-containing flavoprotein (pyridoxamine 5'-phosphate oxidase superfamily)